MRTARQCLVVEQTNRGDRAACPVRFRTRRKRTFIDEIDKIIREENNIMGKENKSSLVNRAMPPGRSRLVKSMH